MPAGGRQVQLTCESETGLLGTAERERTVLRGGKQLPVSCSQSSPCENVGSVASELPKFQEKLKTQRLLLKKKIRYPAVYILA